METSTIASIEQMVSVEDSEGGMGSNKSASSVCRPTDVSEPVRASYLQVIDVEAEVGFPLLAVNALTARHVEWNGHPVTDLHAMNLGSGLHHPTSLLVAKHRAHREGRTTTVHLHTGKEERQG